MSIAPRYATEVAWRCSITNMKTVEEIRRTRLAMLVKEIGSLADLSEKVHKSRRDSTLSQIMNGAIGSKTEKPKTMGSELARRLEAAFNKEPGWMDNDPLLTGELPPGSEMEAETQILAIFRTLGPQAKKALLNSARTVREAIAPAPPPIEKKPSDDVVLEARHRRRKAPAAVKKKPSP